MKMSDDDVLEKFKSIDKDGNGFISIDEFK